jgi:cytochrome P450
MADDGMANDPQPLYRAMRETGAVVPVDEHMVVVCRRAEIDEMFRRTEDFTSNMNAVDLQNKRPLIPLQIDPPEHKKYRRILDPLFAPKRMALLEEPIADLVRELMDAFGGRREIDFAAEFSVPFPSRVFLELLGLPVGDLPTFLAMKDGIVRPEHVVGTEFGSEEAISHQKRTADSIYEYFDAVLDEREAAATDADDLLAAFLHSEIDGETLTREEILDICFLFLIAGLDTVTATLDCMFAYLATHPDHRRQIVEDPSLIPSAIEELLRWETPVMGVARAAKVDTELGGCPIAEGQMVAVMLGAANTDDDEFGDGDVVRFDREINRHLAFGGGVHRCLGSHLARQELRVALREWHLRYPDYAVAEGHELQYTPAIRSIEHFPMVLG